MTPEEPPVNPEPAAAPELPVVPEQIAEFPAAAPPRVMTLRMKSSLSALSVAPSLASGGLGLRFERFEGPAGVESAWHHTQYW